MSGSFTQMKKKNVEGLLEEMHAEILCFQGAPLFRITH